MWPDATEMQGKSIKDVTIQSPKYQAILVKYILLIKTLKKQSMT